MIVDSSVIVAILTGESDAMSLNDVLAASDHCALSVANYLETAIVLDRNPDGVPGRSLDQYLQRSQVELVSVDERQARIAREAYRHFGRSSGHPARLNFGDCFAYALAVDRDEPLLYKGDDFGHTDVRNALEDT